MATKQGSLSINSENILPIIKKWMYSDHDIFFRELVSNGCDAITKLKKLEVMGEYSFADDYKPAIQVIVNPEDKTLKFIDNGIGMTAAEVEEYITQIAFSGATDFLEKYKDKTNEDQIIGHFGLGFYSAFMVADEVHIDTLSFQPDAAPVHWECDGGTEYSISEEGTRTTPGTEITLFLNVDENGATKLADVDGGVEVLPFGGSMTFSVVEKPQANEYFINFGTGTWTIDGENVSVDVWELNDYIPFLDTDAIQINGFNPETMDVVLVVDEDVTLYLNVDENGNTTLADIVEGELPPPGANMIFDIVEKPKFNNTTNSETNACGATLDGDISELMAVVLTEDDLEALENGSEINVYLEVSDITNNVPPAEVSIINSTATHNNATIGKYFDIDLMQQIDLGTPSNITETNGSVTITLEVPNSLINSNASITREYMMIRVHGNGAVANVLPCTYDATSQTVSFETDRFSTYVLVYNDQQNSTGGSIDDTPASKNATMTTTIDA